MDNTVLLAILTIVGSVLGSVVGVWAVTRKNSSDVAKARAMGEVKTQAAETQERADLIDMLKESGKQSVTWLATLKVTEHQRELDYATLKAIIEDGTKETINSRKELLKNLEGAATQAEKNNTGVTNLLEFVRKDLGEMKVAINTLPVEFNQMKRQLDQVLGYLDRVLPKLRSTSEIPAVNGTQTETTPSSS